MDRISSKKDVVVGAEMSAYSLANLSQQTGHLRRSFRQISPTWAHLVNSPPIAVLVLYIIWAHDLPGYKENHIRINHRPIESAITSRLDFAELTVDSDGTIFLGNYHDGPCAGAVYGAPRPNVG